MTTSELCKSIEPAELRKRCGEDPSIQIVDVREFPEYAGGHIAAARLLPLRELPERCGELDMALPVVLVCRSGKRSAQAAHLLSARGFRDVSQLTGGLLAWEAASLPLKCEAKAPWALERQVRLGAGLLLLTGLGLSVLWRPAIAVSWFVAAGLVFAALTDTCAMGMLLARMPWNRQERVSCK
jgi:rhodanese-related sulfurtransferase